MTNIDNLKQQLEVLSKIGLDTSTLQQQLDKLQPNEQPVTLDNAQDVGNEASENERVVDTREPTPPIQAAPATQGTEAQEKGIDEDIDEPSEIQKIAVAPVIEYHQCAGTLACCYLWLTSKNISERKGIVFTIPRPFQELLNKNLWHEVPDQAEWTTWNRLHSSALEKFLTSEESAEEYKQALKEVMCSSPPWWREKYLANSEILQEAS